MPMYRYISRVNASDFDLGFSPKGRISSEAFFEWLANIFFPNVKDKMPFPIIIFMDGHSAHINIAVSDFCRDNNIILYCFPAHASHVLQPLDVSVFGPMKRSWNNQVQGFHAKNRVAMTKVHLLPVFDTIFKEASGYALIMSYPVSEQQDSFLSTLKTSTSPSCLITLLLSLNSN